MAKATVIGAGSWGTALATVLAKNGHSVVIKGKDEAIVKEINSKQKNTRYLKDIVLNNRIRATSSYQEACQNSDVIVLVVPSHAIRMVTREIKPFLGAKTQIVHATKGIENGSLKTMSAVLREELGEELTETLVVLTGPSHAEEVAKMLPTTISAVGQNIESAERIQTLFNNDYFRVYTGSDVIGAELGGSLKNIIALAAGISDGLGYGDNMKAALLTRGLAEMTRLGEALGAKASTFSGLTGIGDLIVTGTSRHSRNWKTGHLIAKGATLEEALEEIGMVAEGVKSTKSAFQLSKKTKVETPITEQLHAILFENKDPKQATTELMNRKSKKED